MKNPPLKLWLFTGVIALILIATLNYYSVNIRRSLFKKPVKVAFELERNDQADVRVLVLGSSYIREALSDPEVMTEYISQNKEGLSYSFVKLMRGGADLEDFAKNEFLINEILRYNPHYILLQESTVFFHNKQKIEALGLRRDISPKMIRTWLMRSDKEYVNQQRNRPNVITSDSSSINRSIVYDRTLRDNVSLLNQFVKKVNAELILLEIPLPKILEDLKDSVRLTSEYQSKFQRIMSNPKVHLLSFDGNLWFRHYYDQAHMNDHGGEIYTRWTLEKLHQFHLSHLANNSN